jgi:hypothetical protein
VNRSLFDEHFHAIETLCREFSVVRLDAFDLPPGDEPGLLVTFLKGDENHGVRRLIELEERLVKLLGRELSLFTVRALQNAWLRAEVWRTRSTLYEAPAKYSYASALTQAENQLGDELVMLHDQRRDA